MNLKLCSYAKRDTRMALDNENDLKEFKEEYRKFLNTLWDDIKNNKNAYKKDPDRGIYSDPDSFFKNNVRNNSLFYEDLCRFLNCQFGSNKYVFKDSYIMYNGDDECYGEKFYPDQFGFSAPCTNLNHIYDRYLKLVQECGKNKDNAIKKITEWVLESRTIGGAFIWPKTKGRRKSYNIQRGGSSNLKGGCYIEDRVDLTLLEIKHYLEGTSRKEEKLPRCREERNWLEIFKKLDPSNPFEKYVDTFHFNSFVDENYMPYDIVNSDFAKEKKKIIKENKVDYSKKNSIYKIEDLETIERILNNVNILIKKRSEQIINEINNGKIIMEKDRKTDCKFFLDGDKGVLLDFSKNKNVMLFDVRYLCDNVTALTVKNNVYYIDDYKYLDKDEMIKYIDEMFDEIRNGTIKGQTYLCSNYHGKYSDIIQTYKKMLDEINDKKYKIIGVPIEQYISSRNGDFVIKIMIPIKVDLYCYATENGKMNLSDENEIREYKEKYQNWLSLLWDGKEVRKPKYQGPSYVDPDMLIDGKKIRINPLFYIDLCAFLNRQSNSKKYTYKPNDKFINAFENKEETFVSDQFGFSAPSEKMDHPYGVYLKKCKNEGKNKKEAIDKVINWVMESRTIGGSFLWPYDVWNPYNTNRGTRSYIEDRVDLTLLEIKHYLDNKGSVEKEILKVNKPNGQKWFAGFSSFEKYVDYFYLNPFVDEKNGYMPYDIVNSDMEHGVFKCLNDEKIKEYKKEPHWGSKYLKENSIFNLNATELEKMFNNVNSMIKERSLMITIDELNTD